MNDILMTKNQQKWIETLAESLTRLERAKRLRQEEKTEHESLWLRRCFDNAIKELRKG